MTRKETKLKKKLKAEAVEAGAASSSGPTEAAGPTDRPFVVKEILGKGMGVVATRDIEPGEVVLKEAPLVRASTDASGDARLERLVAALPPDQQKAYYSHFARNRSGRLSNAVAIFLTNALPLGDCKKSGLFDLGSRFNHSCRPNISHHFDMAQGVSWFIANRNIREGEEICLAYKPVRESKLERQLWLYQNFGFVCTCEACSQSPQEIIASDARRSRLAQIDERLLKSDGKLRCTDPLEVIKLANEAIELATEEGIAMGVGHYAYQAVGACAAHGDRLNAALWIRKTLELDAKTMGVWSTKYKEVEAWKDDPTLHGEWGSIERIKAEHPVLFTDKYSFVHVKELTGPD